jgi:hypothetical protein
MNKLVIDGERASADSVDYGDLVYVMERFNELIDRIEALESHICRTGKE